MLISFSIENWMSFKDKATMSMVASRQSTFSNRLARIKNKLRILPIAAIYGGNASGKSNFCSAIDFARELIVEGTKKNEPINVVPFALCKENRESPSNFWFEILGANQNIYEYSFSVDKEMVHKEKLVKIGYSREEVLFERVFNEFPIIGDDERLKLTSENTRKNQLFLTNTIEQNQDIYKDVYSWFDKGLKIIRPQSIFKFEELLPLSGPWFQKYLEKLRSLDTGISRIDEEPVDDSKGLESPNFRWAIGVLNNKRFFEHGGEEGKKEYKKFVTFHKCHDGEEVKFELGQESDGTIRLLDMLPAFVPDKDSDFEVIIIDEIDRSLHHILIRRLLEYYLQSRNSENRKQIIFTTHDLLLMDQELMRRDEMFVTERNSNGESQIRSISDYTGLRIDKDVRKSYLLGRFGGIPKI